MFLGRFWRHLDGIFSRVTLRTVALYPIITRFRKFCSFYESDFSRNIHANRGIMGVLKSIMTQFVSSSQTVGLWILVMS